MTSNTHFFYNNQVISARKGEFETGYERGGQTREHVQLAKTLGVAKLLVVVNKMDEPTVNWSKERCAFRLTSLFGPTFGVVLLCIHEVIDAGKLYVLSGTMKQNQR